MKQRCCVVERPDTKAVVDFLQEGVSIEASVGEGRLRIVVKMSHGEDTSTWDRHEAEWPLPMHDAPIGGVLMGE